MKRAIDADEIIITAHDAAHERTGDEADIVDMRIDATYRQHTWSGSICVAPDRLNGGYSVLRGAGLDGWVDRGSELYALIDDMDGYDRRALISRIEAVATRTAEGLS